MFDFENELKILPEQSGVYLMHDKRDEIIYVGKAINLKRRVQSYFRSSTKKTVKIQKMVSQIAYFEYIITDSELEALVLENNLIKEYHPKYNTMLKDDKTYPYIKVTVQEDYPRLLFSRMMKKDKAKYFGPYTSAGSVKDTIDLLNKLYKLRTCNRNLPRDIHKERPCLNYHMNQCMAPCAANVTKEEYAVQVQGALQFLNGNYSFILDELTNKMNQASEEMNFEEAIKHRELLMSVKSVAQKQKITGGTDEDKDVIAIAREKEEAVVQIFFIRSGKLIGREHFFMTHILDEEKEEILAEFMKQYYAGTPHLPKTIMLPFAIKDQQTIENYLTMKRGNKVYFVIPQVGQKEKLVELALRNAQLILDKDREKLKREEARTLGAMKEIAELIGSDPITRVEAFDISNINGFQNVGSMVVFEKGKPKRSDYRKFRIKSVEGPDDYGCMREVLTRRFVHGLEERREGLQKDKEEQFGSFTRFPQLILMDGGKGQVNIATEVLESLNIPILVCGMVKDDHHRTRGLYFNNKELLFDSSSEAFKLVTRIQDEAHRFAIEYHRLLRKNANLHSTLDDIKGVGPSRRKALMRYFETMEAMRNASVEELSEVPQITSTVAEEIYRFFH